MSLLVKFLPVMQESIHATILTKGMGRGIEAINKSSSVQPFNFKGAISHECE